MADTLPCCFDKEFFESWQENGSGFDKSIFHPIDSTDPNHYLFADIPIPIHAAYHELMAKHCKTIVSVGTGCGTVDSKLRHFWNCSSYLVDPNIHQDKIWSRKGNNQRVLNPDYAYVKDVILEHPEIVGKCGVSLIYPYPSAGPYDVEAIQLLNPRIIVLLYERNETSGSEQLFEWLGIQQDYTEFASYESMDLCLRYRKGFPFINCLTILIRKDLQIDEPVPSGVHYTEEKYQESKKIPGPKYKFFGKTPWRRRNSIGEVKTW